MSVAIKIENAKKVYGDHTILENLSVDIKDGELFTLLGPSGCGKTTLLRMIAGFNSIEGGKFFFNDQVINDKEPSKRNIGMVFQNYAIFPHLTVKQNVAFGLKNRKLSKDKIEKDTNEMLELMQISKYAERMPERLSGGQQQRVALARAVVIRPDVLLMDEPLSNLDAKLRIDMRTVIRDIQKEVGITTVYVTHDQEEAMSISDRIAVMKDGEIQHIGTPRNIYQRPSNIFVATFIGRSNVIDAQLNKNGDQYEVVANQIHFPIQTIINEVEPQNVKLSIRPEEFQIVLEGGFKAMVKDAVFLGLNTHYTVELWEGMECDIVEESSIDKTYQKGDQIRLTIKAEKVNVFSEDGLTNLVTGVQNDCQ